LRPARIDLLAAATWLLLVSIGAPAFADRHPYPAPVDSSTWVDCDARPIPKPKERDVSLYSYMFREAIVEPFSHAFDIPDKLLWLMKPFGVSRKVRDANTNVYDEVPNSTWFTNRNHVEAVPTAAIREGPFDGVVPSKPWTVTALKKGGHNIGFRIKDADGRKWLVKLDVQGYPQAGSGAGAVVSRLVWTAGYNLALHQAVSFRREDLQFETKVASTKPAAGDDPPITAADIEGILEQGARGPDGRYYAGASFFLPGKPVGPPNLTRYREDDPNDWYRHKSRRDLRGLYVVYSWLNNWDVKDQQSLDMYTGKDKSPGHVAHYIIDVDGSLGAGAEGAKPLPYGYEMRVDLSWTMKRLLTLGFIEEPWRRARQETGIPSVGNFEAREFHPTGWRPLVEVEPFREITPRDAYWGAKLVASFSNAQIAAAIDAAGYEDPRAPAFLLKTLSERRDKVARYWFDRVAPLDFFHVEGAMLRFRDLARDLGLTGARGYEVEIDASPERARVLDRMRLPTTEMALPEGEASHLSLTLSVSGSHAAPVRVELSRRGSVWAVTRVRHA
jgi:hypothetical protein